MATTEFTESKPRQLFHVSLHSSCPAEINFKQLVLESARQLESSELTTPSINAANSVPQLAWNSAPALRPQRFNIIEHLEKRYGGGAVLNDGDGNDVGGLDRRDDDDLYDSEDSFIDDEELQQNIEDAKEQTRIKTKHSGFFVNAGDEIETFEREADEFVDGRGKKRAVDGALRSFLTELPDGASDWQPNVEIVNKLEVLRTAVQELAGVASIPKVFPRSLDEPLRAVDKLVVEAHPNKWRVTGYFATLMTFLPYTKQYLKSNMLRLEARDVARNEKEKLDAAFDTLAQFVSTYEKRATIEPIDVIKTDIAKDTELGTMLHAIIELQEEWVARENEYRQMLKTEDKKHMKESEYKALNQRQERNRMFHRV
ncbi:hypothetical protein Plhal710r2_c005g0024091 [Plasmopara halstedii]